jgi:hypothetical protein
MKSPSPASLAPTDWRRVLDFAPTTKPVIGARLAGEGVREIAFAGKPGSYRPPANAAWRLSLHWSMSASITMSLCGMAFAGGRGN